MKLPGILAVLIVGVLMVSCTSVATTAPLSSEAALPLTHSVQATPTATFTPTTPVDTPTPEAVTATPAATPTPDCRMKGGEISTYELESKLLPKSMPYRVYLPPCYDDHPTRSYPVLYMIHGQSYTDDQWDRLGIDEAADRLIQKGEIPEIIIVMPRDRELVTQPDTNHFADSVAQELVPWVDEHFRTIPERAYRAVGGLSRGGGWALHLALADWELFGALGTHSLAIFWIDTYSIKQWLDDIPAGEMPRIYMDIGDHDRPDLMESNIWFEGLLTERGIPHEWHLFTGYHQETYWQEHVEEYLVWYTEEW